MSNYASTSKRVSCVSTLFRPHSPHCRRSYRASPSPHYATYRPISTLDTWVANEARPISLRQLTFFGRSLTESRLLDSANYVRQELPTRLAHRLRDLQTLPYQSLQNPHINHVYELYYSAFDKLRMVQHIDSLKQNEDYCALLEECLQEHLSVFPQLAMGVLEIQETLSDERCDLLMTALLRSRISRRVIAEQHLTLTDTFRASRGARRPVQSHQNHDDDAVGQVLLKCHAQHIVKKCSATVQALLHESYGQEQSLPEVQIFGNTDTTFPYIASQLEYILGELLRNSMEAVLHQASRLDQARPLPVIQVLICESHEDVTFRISDQGGGIDQAIFPHIWSFARGPDVEGRLFNLAKVPRLVGTMQELGTASIATGQDGLASKETIASPVGGTTFEADRSLSSITARSPSLKLGLGLPMSKIYAEYWAGKLEIHNIPGYGVDAFLQISKFGNRNEVLTTRASMDGV